MIHPLRDLRAAIRYPDEAGVLLAGRTACRLLGWHNITCRGRADHRPDERRW